MQAIAYGEVLAKGEIDFAMQTAAWVVAQVDAGLPITALSGVHPGCYELFVHEPIGTISDFKGKRVGVQYLGSSAHMLLAIMAAQVGLDPRADIEWVTMTTETPKQLFAAGQVDAFLGFPPEPQDLRARDRSRDPQHDHG